jgi:hypothetical protein
MKRRLLSFVTAALLCMGLAVPALAADAPWANDAVDALNSIYGSNTFTADDTVVTVDAAIDLLEESFNYPSDGPLITDQLNTGGNLSRLQAAQIVCGLYSLPKNLSAGSFSDCSDEAVVTIRSLGITGGYPDGTYRPDNEITSAELAVMFFRSLGKIGASDGGALEGLKPGEYGYDEFMYLMARSCIPFDASPTASLGSTSINIAKPYGEEGSVTGTSKETIWAAWCARLGSLPPESNRNVSWTAYDSGDVASATSLLEAAILIVAEDRASLSDDQRGIFSDVNPTNWYYDGVMYLHNNGIVAGFGTGEFEPDGNLDREQMAVVLCRMNNINTYSPASDVTITDSATVSDWAYNAVTHAIAEGLMAYTDGENFSPKSSMTRQEMAQAAFVLYGGYSESNVSLAVLDRFIDSDAVSEEYKAGVAYCVSVGIINGTADGRMAPNDPVNRATMGVFFSRIMQGLDTSKMHDYTTAIEEVLR